ncbi:hypothetical protein SAY87_029531 [Trapa incisa]|uniref:Uncharacterized protein n=1 Tax=Trapa incisa TaxID=236973 RepID=A0AAN7KD21_9MYRT|nr:hypothetical protein SAY87_029531 [Trapa incisa]
MNPLRRSAGCRSTANFSFHVRLPPPYPADAAAVVQHSPADSALTVTKALFFIGVLPTRRFWADKIVISTDCMVGLLYKVELQHRELPTKVD